MTRRLSAPKREKYYILWLEENFELRLLTLVYLGYRMEPEKKKHIIEITQRKNQLGGNITVYEAILSCDTYEFDFVKLI